MEKVRNSFEISRILVTALCNFKCFAYIFRSHAMRLKFLFYSTFVGFVRIIFYYED